MLYCDAARPMNDVLASATRTEKEETRPEEEEEEETAPDTETTQEWKRTSSTIEWSALTMALVCGIAHASVRACVCVVIVSRGVVAAWCVDAMRLGGQKSEKTKRETALIDTVGWSRVGDE